MDWKMGPRDSWDRLASFLRGLAQDAGQKPKAILIVSAHWEEPSFTVLDAAAPPLLYDYYGFPEHTYRLKYPAPGSPEVAARAASLLRGAGLSTASESARGFDHGVFIPLMLAFPQADVPIAQLSLKQGLDPAEHLAAGQALEPLRDEGVLIIGSGLSYHDLRGLFQGTGGDASSEFDLWLESAATAPAQERKRLLCAWSSAPSARLAHPREDHLLPLMVVAGAAGPDRGERIFADRIMGAIVSAHRFG
jgi:aromatic ring-opening dioxygenase catalytic subunit (LigB family)